ncbi:arylesterase [Desulfosediminicola ganghwensis]|uniref:arylesterase n=1 Tax=Desulfosediminicola ganghwensis TaxID=2569540 RepID=UPI0010AD7F04|nr:arylesterase [Desulfosediminicola ganghwensis]
MKKGILAIVLVMAGWLGYIFIGGDDDYKIVNIPVSVSRIVCFGDSLTAGVGASKGRDYPARLAEMTGIEVINSGVPGDTTADGLARLQHDVLDLEPSVVLITLGGNDLRKRVDIVTVEAHLTSIVEEIQGTGAMVVLGGLQIPLYGREFSTMYESVARKTGAVLIPNIFKGIFSDRNLMSDSIHPNDGGYEIMTGYFYEALQPYLDFGGEF